VLIPLPKLLTLSGIGFTRYSIMTKRLILFRHGKSDWDANFSRDHDRPVAERGIKAARAMGKLLAAAEAVPDSVVSSSAARAQTTMKLAIEAGDWQCQTRITDNLYEASVHQVLAVVHQEPDHHQSLMLVGHEPTWSELTTALIGGGQVRVPTAAMVCVEFDVSTWQQVTAGRGMLLWLLPPKLMTKAKLF
jgi:phosphohistidine phosphatase